MSFYDLIVSRRSIRQFRQKRVSRNILERLVDTARLAPSAANRQPLEFVVIDEQKTVKQIFPCLKWAAYIAPEGNPKPGHEPAAYIVILVNTNVSEKEYEWDVGASIENMILTALEEGIGSCWLISVDRDKVKGILNIPDKYKIDSVLALGYPAEIPVIEDMNGSVKYWKDNKAKLHVPKRTLEDVIHLNRF